LPISQLKILNPRPFLESSLNSTGSFKRRKQDLATKFSSKKSLKLTNAEKKICDGKEQTGFQLNLFGTLRTIPEPSPI
jgi:hypothetical protein